MLWRMQFDVLSPLAQQGTVGLLAVCAIMACIALWRRDAKRLETERQEKEELRKEVKDLNMELRTYLLQQQLQQPRTTRLLDAAINIVKEQDVRHSE